MHYLYIFWRFPEEESERKIIGSEFFLMYIGDIRTGNPREKEREREIERDFYFFESASGRFEPATPV